MIQTLDPRETKKSRLEVVDALRGFAVMAILLVHSLEHFIYPVYPDKSTQWEWLNILDEGVFSIIFTLFAGKAYAIFAILFGLTFYIQYNNQLAKGNDFGCRFLWRLLLLVAFAALNAAFFPAGDVLLLFSIVGMVLFIVRKWSNKTIFALAIICLCQPVEWFYYIYSVTHPLTNVFPDLKIGEMYHAVSEYTKAGDFTIFILGNVTLGQKASLFWAIGAGRVWQTAGLFMIGYLLGRKQRFTFSKESTKFWIKVLITSSILFAPLYEMKNLLYGNEIVFVSRSVGIVADMWQKLAFTCVLISSFVLLYQTEIFKRHTNSLRFYGRMSLTNYIAQSIWGALIYFPFALNLAPYCGYTLSLLIGIAFFVLQVQFCKWWLKSHKQGPLEFIWHRWTWIGSNKK